MPPQPGSNIRLGERQAQALAYAVSKMEETPENVKRRNDSRTDLPEAIRVIVQVQQVGGSQQLQLASVRDVSSGGLAMFWGTFLHVGSKCTFTFVNNATREPIQSVAGEVVRCVFLKANVHDVGIKFSEKIDLSRLPGWSAQATNPITAAVEPAAQELIGLLQEGHDARKIEEAISHLTEVFKKAAEAQSRVA